MVIYFHKLQKMGIQDLKSFLRDKNIDYLVQNYPLSNLEGYRIAIDMNNFLIIHASIINKDLVSKLPDPVNDKVDPSDLLYRVYIKTINYALTLMNNGITPIMVFDGKSRDEKKLEIQKRREAREKRQDKLEKLREEIEKVPVYLREVKNLGTVPKELQMEVVKYSSLVSDLKKLMSSEIKISYDQIVAVKELFQSLGIPCITAEHDGEMTCAELHAAGQVAATFSTDSDCLVLGIGFCFDSLTGPTNKRGGFISGSVLDPVLKQLDMSFESFRDFCILLGTDFNSRIRGYGPAKAYKLIQEYKNIETIAEKTGLDITPLNYKVTRELLTPAVKDWSDKQLDIDFCLFENYASQVLNQRGLSNFYQELKEAVANIKKVRNGS